MAYFLLSFVLTKLWQGGAACFSLIEEREKTGAQDERGVQEMILTMMV